MTQHKKIIFLMTLLALTTLTAHSAMADTRRLTMSMTSQLENAVDDLKAKMNADSELKGRKLKPGKFTTQNLPDSNFELEFENQLRRLLGDALDEKSDFVINGEYNAVPGEAPENVGLKVVQLVLKVINPQLRQLQTVIKEVNDSSDVSRILGVTVAPPDSPKIEDRLNKIDEARKNPEFAIRDQTRITAPGKSDFAVEVVRHPGGSEVGTPVTPTDLSGNAFVDLEISDCFSMVLYNFSKETDVVAKISIDGLDVANEFCDDNANYPGYLVPKSSEHSVPGWLRTTKSAEKNVFQFVINQPGKGAATERKARGSRGVMTVQFFEASDHPSDLPARAFGEVGKGKPMDVAYNTKEVFLRDAPVSVVSIRYSHQ